MQLTIYSPCIIIRYLDVVDIIADIRIPLFAATQIRGYKEDGCQSWLRMSCVAITAERKC